MSGLRILADDLTGALDCAAAFGAGIAVHLARPAAGDGDDASAPMARETGPRVEIVATATRDVPPADLPELLSPSLAWLRDAAIAFKKVDSLLRGNTFDEVDWLASRAPFGRLAFVPAFPAQHRVTRDGQQRWRQPDGSLQAVTPSIREALQAQGWQVTTDATPPASAEARVAWVPDVMDDATLQAVLARGLDSGDGWLWCGSAGLAHALARRMPQAQAHCPGLPCEGRVMLVSASHHPVSREQWQVLRASGHGADCHSGEDPRSLEIDAARYPALIDLSAAAPLTPQQAADLLQAQARALARHAPRPRVLVVVGGDTLLALCQALGAHGLRSGVPLQRTGWGCARLVGGRWDGLVCHTRSGAFGGPQDLVEVVGSV